MTVSAPVDSRCEPPGNGLRGERIFGWLYQHIRA
jgi:hypothetical protein